MISLSDPLWQALRHAYGSARDIPPLLSRAALDTSPGHVEGGAWFDLWSALCHQGDAYTASYAAVPHLADIAHSRRGDPSQFDPLFLVACIELARLEGQGPDLTDDLASAYTTALQKTLAMTEEALLRPWDEEFREGLRAGRLALAGNCEGARAILDADLEAD
jgi:hypothetical protein